MSQHLRSRRARLVVPALLALVGLVTAGCGAFGGSPGMSDRSRLVNDMTAQLARAAELRYHAQYQLAGGGRGSISQQQQPNRLTLAYPGGMTMFAGAEQTVCVTAVRPARCQVRLLAGEDASPVAGHQEAITQGMVGPAVVAELLAAVIAQPLAGLRAYDATLAGQQATCLEATGLAEPAAAAAFAVCVTADGALAGFTGTVRGVAVDQALTRYGKAPPIELFSVPEGAVVTDHRPKAS
jgi:hypothetical protein